MASLLLNPNPKPLNSKAASFNPMATSPNEPFLVQKPICLPHELYHQPSRQLQLVSIPVVTHGFSYYPRYMYEPRQVWLPNPHVVCYNTVQQPYYVGCGDKEKVVEEVKRSGVEVSAGILGCGQKRNVMRRVVGESSLRSQRRDSIDKRNTNKCWIPKKANKKTNCGGVGAGILPSPTVMLGGGKTSIMIRNIPNQLRRLDMLQILDKHCYIENKKAELRSDTCRSAYDLLYLPMDFGFDSNLGYAFVNFTNAVGALRFNNFFHKYDWKVAENKKICEISWAKYQGKNALRNHLAPMKFECHSNEYLPVVFSPPRDGRMCTRPTFIGTRVNPSPSTLNHKREMLKIRRRNARC